MLCPDRLTPNFDKLIPFSSKSQKWKGFSNQKSKKPTKCHLPCRAVDRQAQLHKTGQLHPPKATSGLSTYDSSEVNKHIKTNKKLEGFLKICSHFKKPPQRGCIPRAHAATSARRSPQAAGAAGARRVERKREGGREGRGQPVLRRTRACLHPSTLSVCREVYVCCLFKQCLTQVNTSVRRCC